jgi:hypothetical protein
MKSVVLNFEEVHEVVERNRFLEWDGWDVVTWRRDPRGYADRRGSFRAAWGILFRYPVQADGTWKVPVAYVTAR